MSPDGFAGAHPSPKEKAPFDQPAERGSRRQIWSVVEEPTDADLAERHAAVDGGSVLDVTMAVAMGLPMLVGRAGTSIEGVEIVGIGIAWLRGV